MIFLKKDSDVINPAQGITRRTLAQSRSMMLCEFTFDANVTIPIHSHPHEQVGYLVEGRVIMTIDGQDFEIRKGDSYCAPSNVLHGASILEPSVIIDTFSPPREDYR